MAMLNLYSIAAESALKVVVTGAAAQLLDSADECEIACPMCLISFAWKTAGHELLLVANRDEAHERPAAPLDWWSDKPQICGGRDLREGGSWLAMHRSGRLAAVTNVRQGEPLRSPRSRGALVTRFLESPLSAAAFAEILTPDASQYGAYNLLLWDGQDLVYASNQPCPLWCGVEPGLHGLSNAQLDTPWPKVIRARHGLARWLADGSEDLALLFTLMRDGEPASDDELPGTGVPLELERGLSPPFIHLGSYGTRCTTVVDIRRGSAQLLERRFGPDGAVTGNSRLQFRIAL